MLYLELAKRVGVVVRREENREKETEGEWVMIHLSLKTGDGKIEGYLKQVIGGWKGGEVAKIRR